MTRKRSFKGRKNKLALLLLVSVMLLVLLTIGFIIKSNKFKNHEDFKIEDRKQEIKKSKETDEKNYKTVGWIRVEGTNIDMPIVTIYDKSEFPVTKESYSWTITSDDEFYNVMRIYGHNIFNLSSQPKKKSPSFKRFESLLSFVYYDFAKENQYIQLTIKNKDYLYKIFSVGMIDYDDMRLLPRGEYSKKEIKNTIKLFKENTIYDYNIRVGEKDKILSLVTCTRMFGRKKEINLVVSAKKINNEDRTKLTRVRKTKKYKKIEESLKGDEEDEA